MSKPLASFLSSLLCARTERGAQLSRDSGVRSFLSSSSSSRERQSVVPWGTRVQLVHGLTAPETSRPLLPGRLLPEDSRARLRHFHPTVVAHIERWATGVIADTIFIGDRRTERFLGPTLHVQVPAAARVTVTHAEVRRRSLPTGNGLHERRIEILEAVMNSIRNGLG